MHREKIFYCYHLDLFVGHKIFFYSLRFPVTKVIFITNSQIGMRILEFALKLGRIGSCEKYEIDYSSHMPQGGGLYFGVHHQTIEISKKISSRIIEQHTFLDFLPGQIDPKRKVGFIRKAVDIQIYPAILLTLIAEKEWFRKESNSVVGIFVRLGDLFSYFLDESSTAMDVEYFNIIDIKATLISWVIRFIKEQIGVLIKFLRSVFTGVRLYNYFDKPSVAIQNAWGLKQNFRLDDFWWFRYSGLDNSRLIAVFNRSKLPVTDQVVHSYNDKGYRCAILDDGANQTTTTPTKKYELLRIRWLFTDFISLVRVRNWNRKIHAPVWQVTEWLIVMSKIRFWQAFMQAENVKVIFDLAETSRDISALAADMVGCIKIGYHWSDHSHPRAMLLSLHHVYFVWGEHYQKIMREMGSVSNLARIGCIYDSLDARIPISESSIEHRNKLKLNGVEYILAILDRSCHPMSHIPPNYHADFYNQLFDLVVSNPKVGLIIKPKYPTPQVFDYRADVFNNYKRAMITNRMITLDGNRHVSEAGLASDLVVVLGPNSGGIICALRGCRVISWDPSGASLSIQKEWVTQNGWGDRKIVYHSIEDWCEALTTVSDGVHNQIDIGDFSKYRDQIDCFQDGKAGIRVGEFIHEFIIGCDKGLDRDEALRVAFCAFGKKWGDENIDIYSQ
jgi:hypothetical protein